MKKLLLPFFLFPCLTLCAQTTKSEVLQDVRQTGGTYFAYQAPASEISLPPTGYVPFYISHYGRHGSRYMDSFKYYERALRYLSLADTMGILTGYGKDVLARVRAASIDAIDRDGDLTRLGGEQHQGIAARMYERCSEAFSEGAQVHAIASQSRRCIVSMGNFCMSLKDKAPAADIFMETSKRYMYYIAAGTKEFAATHQDSVYEQKTHDFEKRLFNADRLMSSLFIGKGYPKHHSQQEQLMWALFKIAIDLQGLPELSITLWDAFTDDELFAMWQMDNVSWCRSIGLFPGCAPRYKAHYPLVRDIISKADSVISCGGHGADLRFGHDAMIVPLAYIMQLDECRNIPTDFHELYKYFSSYKITPMAANIQLIFYKNASNDILVKILHNERESSVPLKTACFPYYRWKDLKQYLENRMSN